MSDSLDPGSDRRPARRRLAAMSVAVALSGALALGVATPPILPGAAAAAAAKPGFPAVNVTDLVTGRSVSLTTLATSRTPVLYWMWAPS